MQIKKMNPHTSNVIRNLNGSYVKKSEDLIYPVERNIGNASSNECNNDDDDCLNSKEIEYDQCRSSADRESVVKDSIDNIPKIPSESNINQSHCENVNRTDVVRVKSNSNKLNFSVDRLLNKCDISEKTEIKNAICVKRCPSEILTVDKLLSLPVSRVNELEKCNKTIIRPMPVRYMQPSTTIPVSYSPGVTQRPPSAAAVTMAASPPAPTRIPSFYKFSNVTFDNAHFLTEKSNFVKAHPFNLPQRHHFYFPRSQPVNQQSHQDIYIAKDTVPSNQILSKNTTRNQSVVPAPTSVPRSNASTLASSHSKRKRSWSRAVFSQLQRKGLEIQFQIQKYITKPDRRKLAARLGLTDAQVKVWFQNRRMKWRHTRENKHNNKHSGKNANRVDTGDKTNKNHEGQNENHDDEDDDVDMAVSFSGSSSEDEIDVEAIES